MARVDLNKINDMFEGVDKAFVDKEEPVIKKTVKKESAHKSVNEENTNSDAIVSTPSKKSTSSTSSGKTTVKKAVQKKKENKVRKSGIASDENRIKKTIYLEKEIMKLVKMDAINYDECDTKIIEKILKEHYNL